MTKPQHANARRDDALLVIHRGLYYTTRQAATLLGVCLRTIQLWCTAGKLACVHTKGGHRKILGEHIAAAQEWMSAEAKKKVIRTRICLLSTPPGAITSSMADEFVLASNISELFYKLGQNAQAGAYIELPWCEETQIVIRTLLKITGKACVINYRVPASFKAGLTQAGLTQEDKMRIFYY